MIKMKKYLIIMVCAILLPAAAASTVSAIDGGVPNVVLEADQSVVRVIAPLGDIYGDGEFYYQEGSAFVISQTGGSTYLVTNLHVVSLMDVARNDKVYILRENTEGAILEASVIYPPNSVIDLVFLRVDTGLASRPVLKVAKSETVQRGDACYAAGFPDAADQIRDDGKNLPSNPEDVTFSSGIISQVGGEYLGQKTLQITAYISHGNSGGPLLNQKGEVIGINTYGNDGVNKSIFSDYITEAADRMDVPYTLAGDKEGLSALTIAGIGGGALVVIVLAAIIIIVSRSKKLSARQSAVRDAKAAAPVVPSAAQPPPAMSPRPQSTPRLQGLRGTGGQYNTTTFEVSDRTLIGRDPARCAIVFTPQAQGVSSLHCEILRVGDRLMIIDHNSTYGTFLSGARLQPNVPVELKASSSFYLGDPRNSFAVY